LKFIEKPYLKGFSKRFLRMRYVASGKEGKVYYKGQMSTTGENQIGRDSEKTHRKL
jgi:hypothetical protein